MVTNTATSLSPPRYEFRVFADDLNIAASNISKYSAPGSKGEKQCSEDIYLISEQNEEYIIKIRDEKLDVKQLLHTSGPLEQWQPILKETFPLSDKLLRESLFPALKADPPRQLHKQYTLTALLELIDSHPYINAVNVKKERQSSQIGAIRCEVDHIFLHAEQLMSICCESTDPKALRALLQKSSLLQFTNTSYLQLLKSRNF